MATKESKLTMHNREKVGTTGAQGLRAHGQMPAVVYGHGTPAQHIAIDAHAFEDLIHRAGRNTMITLSGEGNKTETVLVRDVQVHPVTRHPLHADFLRVSADEAVHAKLPIVAVGTPRGVRDQGGVMDVVLHELEVEGPANRLPESIEVNVTELGVHEHASAGDIALPAGFKLITPAETIVVSIEASKTAQDLEAAAAGPTEQLEPQVIGETPGAATE